MTARTKHAPGPQWIALASDEWGSVAACNHGSDQVAAERTAAAYRARHGRSIVTTGAVLLAAPDLLAALREIAAMGEACACKCGPEAPADHWTTCPRSYARVARAAIAKAEGGQS